VIDEPVRTKTHEGQRGRARREDLSAHPGDVVRSLRGPAEGRLIVVRRPALRSPYRPDRAASATAPG
jgi:hypothetical protein